MTTNTPNLSLITYNSTTDGSYLFSDFRANVAGISATSNVNKIDTWAGLVSGSIASLYANKPIYPVAATYVSENYYEATVSSITSYSVNTVISLSLDIANSGTITLNINGLGTKTLQKIDVNGNAVNFDASELKSGKEYLFRYTSGGAWEWIAATSADQISISGSSSNFSMISGCGFLIDSGVSASSFASSTGSYVSLALNPNLKNEWLLSSGSGNSLIQNSSASTVRVDVNAISPIVSSGSELSHANSGVVAGSYMNATVQVDKYGHVVSASTIAIGSVGQLLRVNASGNAPEWGGLVGAFGFDSNTGQFATGNYSTITFDSESFDSHGFIDVSGSPTKITIPTNLGGVYLAFICCSAGTASSSSGDMAAYLYRYDSGGTLLETLSFNSGSLGNTTKPHTISGIAIFSVNSGDYFIAKIYNELGVNGYASGVNVGILRLTA